MKLRLPIYWAAEKILETLHPDLAGNLPANYNHEDLVSPLNWVLEENQRPRLVEQKSMAMEEFRREAPGQGRFKEGESKDLFVVLAGRRIGSTTLAEALHKCIPNSKMVTRDNQRHRFRGEIFDTLIFDSDCSPGNIEGILQDHPRKKVVLIINYSEKLPRHKPPFVRYNFDAAPMISLPTRLSCGGDAIENLTNSFLNAIEEFEPPDALYSWSWKRPERTKTYPRHVLELVKFAKKTLLEQGFDLEEVLRAI